MYKARYKVSDLSTEPVPKRAIPQCRPQSVSLDGSSVVHRRGHCQTGCSSGAAVLSSGLSFGFLVQANPPTRCCCETQAPAKHLAARSPSVRPPCCSFFAAAAAAGQQQRRRCRHGRRTHAMHTQHASRDCVRHEKETRKTSATGPFAVVSHRVAHHGQASSPPPHHQTPA